MAGRGPAPKDPNKRARRNGDPVALRVVHVAPATQPELTDLLGDVNPATREPWTRATVDLWQSLGDHPSTSALTRAQWHVLARAMILDDAAIRGEVKLSGEVRLQLAKFFVAPDDMLRGRYQSVVAEEAEGRRDRQASSASRTRRGPLKAVEENPDDATG